MNRSSIWLPVLVVLVGVFFPLPAQAQVVVAHPGVAFSSITKQSLEDILTGRIPTLPDGEKATIIIARASTATDRLLSDLTGGDDFYQFKLGWTRRVYVGKGQLPLFVADNKELLEKVAAIPGAIGLAESTDPGVKVIALK